nr:hypothetical protein [Actinoplanes ovalisporus]
MTVLTVESVTRRRISRLNRPTSQPTRLAATTDQANVPRALQNENIAAEATIAVRSRTRAVASLSRPSPSSIATTRCDTGVCLMIEVATASVGLTIAPRATPHAKPRSGTARWKKRPRASALPTTSTTDRPPMAPNSRRKFIAGIATADE